MRRALAVAVLAVAPPSHGVLVPGHSLGGVRLGEPQSALRAQLGSFHGVCRGCPVTTWYFTYRRFDQHGVGVELRRRRVDAVFTLWSPPGWRTTSGLRLGAPVGAVPVLPRVRCRGYSALLARSRGAVTAYYVVGRKLWGFGLLRPGSRVCR